TTVTAPSFAPRVPWHEATWFEVASNAGVLLFLMVAPIACILALLLIFK
ncbi:MAG: hypothetical protein HY719_09125, partial [Planctomycetes bacterium]|nr:hypothetical protein [Planctomycetota bacterium]